MKIQTLLLTLSEFHFNGFDNPLMIMLSLAYHFSRGVGGEVLCKKKKRISVYFLPLIHIE